MPKKYCSSAVAVAAVVFLHAVPAAAVDNANAVWAVLSANGAIRHDNQATRWRYHVDAQWRHSDRGAGSEQYVVQSSLGYDLNARMNVWAGYGYFVTDPDTGSNLAESRWWQQFTWVAAEWDRASLLLRTRLEQRLREDGDDTAWRIRQQVQLLVPLNARRLTLIGSLEPLVNLRDTDWGARSGIDVVRAYLGVRMPVTERTSLEAAYMYQYVNRRGLENAANHVAVLHLSTRFR